MILYVNYTSIIKKLYSYLPINICHLVTPQAQGCTHLRQVCSQHAAPRKKPTQPWKGTQGH